MKKILRRIVPKLVAQLLGWVDHYNLLPFCPEFGVGRGGSVGRLSVDRFMKINAPLVRGRILEFGSRAYERYLIKSQISVYDVMSVIQGTDVTIMADLQKCPEVPSNSYDTIICTQVLEHVFDFHAALRELFRLLVPGGTLILSVPFIARIHAAPDDYWRFSPHAIERLLGQMNFKDVQISQAGSMTSSTMYLLGLGVADKVGKIFDKNDGICPINVFAIAKK